MRLDDVRRFCFPCSEETGRMVGRVCVARETKKRKTAEERRILASLKAGGVNLD